MLIMLATLVWMIVRFWHLRPLHLLAFSGLWLVGSALVGYSSTLDSFVFDWDQRMPLRIFFSSGTFTYMLLFSLLVSLIALIRSTVGEKKIPDTAPVAKSDQQDRDSR